MSQKYGRPWRRVREEILARDGGLCQIRGPRCKVTATTVDHITPLRLGGALLDPNNLRAACGTCNYGNGGRLGHQTRRVTRPAPVHYRNPRW